MVPVGAGAVRPERQPWRSNGAALSELGAAVAAQRPRFGDDQPMLHRRGMCRIAVAVAEVLVWDTAAAAAQGQPLRRLGQRSRHESALDRSCTRACDCEMRRTTHEKQI